MSDVLEIAGVDSVERSKIVVEQAEKNPDLVRVIQSLREMARVDEEVEPSVGVFLQNRLTSALMEVPKSEWTVNQLFNAIIAFENGGGEEIEDIDSFHGRLLGGLVEAAVKRLWKQGVSEYIYDADELRQIDEDLADDLMDGVDFVGYVLEDDDYRGVKVQVKGSSDLRMGKHAMINMSYPVSLDDFDLDEKENKIVTRMVSRAYHKGADLLIVVGLGKEVRHGSSEHRTRPLMKLMKTFWGLDEGEFQMKFVEDMQEVLLREED